MFKIKTTKREQVVDITEQIKKEVNKDGAILVYVPHATAAITINENYDPNIGEDLLNSLRDLIPKGKWKHDRIDGNGDSHIKSAIIGPSEIIPIKNKKLQLGRWQAIILLEFDGPRERTIITKQI
jgi:secondary thiamine-phosphate synthase enzyme